ncbi:MAG: NAD(P)/FAD-dependent oxidoreductase [Acidimicrobiia bacterium]|nr:NAD(P)/FAD-dependent oxidoreductase [Acidimicrobiia bacterium]
MGVRKVVIVGGGPAGSAAAIAASRRGADVVLIDRAIFPRNKACGDAITPTGMETLHRLGASAVVERGWAIEGARFRHGNMSGRAYRLDHPLGITIPRHDLDAYLVELAVESGTTLIQGDRVTDVVGDAGSMRSVVTNSGRSFDADIFIGAFGTASPLHPIFGGNPDSIVMSGLAIRSYATGMDPEAASCLDFIFPIAHSGQLIPGYGWAFPIKTSEGELRVNVGVGIMSAHYASVSARALLSETYARLREIDEFTRVEPLDQPAAGLLRSSPHIQLSSYSNVLFVGDAAGLVNPVTGEGIAAALASGEMAGSRAAALGEEYPDCASVTSAYVAGMGHVNESLFKMVWPHASEPAGWELCGVMMNTQRPTFRALRRTWVKEFVNPELGIKAEDTPNDAVGSALATVRSPLLERALIELRKDRDSPIGRVVQSLVAPGSVLSQEGRDVTTALELLDLQAQLMLDVQPNGSHDTVLSNGLPLLLADMILVQVQRIGVRTEAARSLLIEFGRSQAIMGIKLRQTSDAKAVVALLMNQAGLLLGSGMKHLVGLGPSPAAPEVISLARLVGCLHDVTWRLGKVRHWRRESPILEELPPWASRDGKGMPALEDALVDEAKRLLAQKTSRQGEDSGLAPVLCDVQTAAWQVLEGSTEPDPGDRPLVSPGASRPARR